MLAGAALNAVVADWNQRGITTPRGNPWRKSSVKDVLRNPRVAGIRSRALRTVDPVTQRVSRFVENVLDANGEPVRGQWEPILPWTGGRPWWR